MSEDLGAIGVQSFAAMVPTYKRAAEYRCKVDVWGSRLLDVLHLSITCSLSGGESGAIWVQ